MDFKKLIEACKASNINDVELSLEHEEVDQVSLFDGVVDENKAYETTYGNVRAVVDGKLVSYYVENMNDDNIPNVVARLKAEASIIENKAPAFMYDDKTQVQIFDNEDNDFAEYSKADQIEFLKKLSKEIKGKSQFCKNVRCSFGVAKASKTIMNSKGLNKTHGETQGFLTAQAVVRKDGDTRGGFTMQKVNNFKDIDKEKIFKETVEEALAQIGANSLESKGYKVVFKNSCMNILLSAFADQFSSESVLKKMSSFIGKEGSQIFGKNVNIIDDPMRDEFNHVPFDDEGVDTYRKYIVENGKLNTFMYNLSTAKEMNQKSTGNGFKSNGIQGNVGVKAANLYLEEGTKTLEEVFKDVDNGVYITSMQGAHAGINRASGDFNLQSSGYLIENGKLGRPVTLIIVSGNFFDMMNHVVECANNLEFRFGTGSADTYIERLNISGK